MKTALTIAMFAALTITANVASAAHLKDARLNLENQTIELDVVYNGGCVEHNFELEVRSCNRTLPMSCVARIVDSAQSDSCRAVISETVEVSAVELLEKMALSEVVILGAGDSAVHVQVR